MAENPARGIKAPRVGRSERSAFAPDVVRQIVDAQPEVRDQACLMLLGRLGLRRDELRQLQIHDVDLARDTVRVQGKGGKVALRGLDASWGKV
jgi:site-specific recombinase XerC